ncbi:MAG: site-2 protease family protein [Dehalococcoidia bacterium]
MLFQNLGFQQLLVLAIAIAMAITVHEFSHALAATRLGDDTARLQGRLSLNPLVHLDFVGTLFLFLMGFGWGKPVPVNQGRLRGGYRGMGKVALAGPVSGLVVAGLLGLAVQATGISLWTTTLGLVLLYVIRLNIVLSLFNLIPLPPLDGHKVAVGFLPPSLSLSFQRLERYGIMPLFLLILADSFLGIGILWGIIGPGVNFFTGLFLGEALL